MLKLKSKKNSTKAIAFAMVCILTAVGIGIGSSKTDAKTSGATETNNATIKMSEVNVEYKYFEAGTANEVSSSAIEKAFQSSKTVTSGDFRSVDVQITNNGDKPYKLGGDISDGISLNDSKLNRILQLEVTNVDGVAATVLQNNVTLGAITNFTSKTVDGVEKIGSEIYEVTLEPGESCKVNVGIRVIDKDAGKTAFEDLDYGTSNSDNELQGLTSEFKLRMFGYLLSND